MLPCYSNEWMAGEINHAIYLNTMCEARGAVFPSRNQNQALTCDRAKWPWPMANETGARPKHGSLYFLDYTDEQIEAMHLPAWQKPMIVAMSHYGGYVGDTGGSQRVRTIRARTHAISIRPVEPHITKNNPVRARSCASSQDYPFPR